MLAVILILRRRQRQIGSPRGDLPTSLLLGASDVDPTAINEERKESWSAPTSRCAVLNRAPCNRKRVDLQQRSPANKRLHPTAAASGLEVNRSFSERPLRVSRNR